MRVPKLSAVWNLCYCAFKFGICTLQATTQTFRTPKIRNFKRLFCQPFTPVSRTTLSHTHSHSRLSSRRKNIAFTFCHFFGNLAVFGAFLWSYTVNAPYISDYERNSSKSIDCTGNGNPPFLFMFFLLAIIWKQGVLYRCVWVCLTVCRDFQSCEFYFWANLRSGFLQ